MLHQSRETAGHRSEGLAAGLGQGPRNRAGGTSNPKRACAGDPSHPQRKPRRVGATKEGLRVQAAAWIRRTRASRQCRRRACTPAPACQPWRGLCGAAVGGKTLPADRGGAGMDGSPRLGLSRRDLSPVGPRLAAGRPAGSRAPRRMAANLRGGLASVKAALKQNWQGGLRVLPYPHLSAFQIDIAAPIHYISALAPVH
jgi:hypothetical protein